MSDKLSFGSIMLAGTGKRGIVAPDANGYYRINGGSFGRPNRFGITYDINEYIRSCLGPGSPLRRRIDRGEVYSEMGHPPMFYLENINGSIVRTRITNSLEWVARLKFIDMDRVCGHIREFIFDTSNYSQVTGKGYIDFEVDIKPFGPFGSYFKDNLDSPDMNTALSIRTVTEPHTPHDKLRQVEHLSNVDWIPEPGFAHACKHQSAGLEGFIDSIVPLGPENGMKVETDQVIGIIETALKESNARESVMGMECYNGLEEMLKDMKSSRDMRANRSHLIIPKSAIDLF